MKLFDKIKLHSKWLFATYVIVILLFVTLPINTVSLNTVTSISFRGDYFLHAVTFIPWAFFGWLLRRKMVYWFIVGVIFAGGVEGIQYLLSYRAFNINDMIGNIIGVVLGFIAFGLFHFYLPQNNDK